MRQSAVAACRSVAPQGAAVEDDKPLAIRVGRAWLFWILLATAAFWAAAAALALGASWVWLLAAPAALTPLFGALAAGLLSDRAMEA